MRMLMLRGDLPPAGPLMTLSTSLASQLGLLVEVNMFIIIVILVSLPPLEDTNLTLVLRFFSYLLQVLSSLSLFLNSSLTTYYSVKHASAIVILLFFA
jgi:hypothetical protein